MSPSAAPDLTPNLFESRARPTPATCLGSLLADYQGLRELHQRVMQQLDACAAQGFEGPQAAARLRAWTALVQTAAGLVERLHAYRERDVILGEIVRTTIDTVIDRMVASSSAALRNATAAIPDDPLLREDVARLVEGFISEQFDVCADAAAENAFAFMRTKLGLFDPGVA